MNEEPWFVYLLECSDGTIYTGITNNVEKRLKKHNDGTGAKYTKARRPVKLLKFFSLPNRSEASKIEYFIKQLPREKKLQFNI